MSRKLDTILARKTNKAPSYDDGCIIEAYGRGIKEGHAHYWTATPYKNPFPVEDIEHEAWGRGYRVGWRDAEAYDYADEG